MRMSIALCGVLLLPLIGSAQPTQTTDQRLGNLDRRFNEELKRRDDEIARLHAELQNRPTTAPANDDIEKTKQDILKDIQTSRQSPLTLRTPANFNPDLAVIGDFKGNVSTANNNPARNRFDLFTVEFELRAAVDPRADAVAVIPFTRDVDDPLFFNKSDANGDVNSGVEIEEAYLFLHDFGVPNLTAKLGRFHLRFGRQNILHHHDWPTSDNNFVNQSFLAGEAIADSGLSLSYVIPPKLVGGQYIEAIVEIISGEGSTDNPVLNNSAFVNSPGINVHMLWNHDIARDWNLEIGGSMLAGKHN